MEQKIYQFYKLLWLCILCQGISLVSSCGFQYVAVKDSKNVILSPNYPGPPPFVKNCFYEIAFPRNSHHDYYMEIEWEEFDLVAAMPNCIGNFVEIEIGSAYMGRICGNSAPHPIYSLQETVKLKLTSDGVSSSGGFRLSYTLRSKDNSTLIGDKKDDACSSLSIGSGGLLFTEPWPLMTWEPISCTYDVKPPPGHATRISIMNVNMMQGAQGPCENQISVIGSVGDVDTLIYSSNCKDLRGIVIESKSTRIKIIIGSIEKPVDYTGFIIGFITFEGNDDVIDTTPLPPEKDSTSGVLIGLGVAVFLCIVILLFIFWKRRKALDSSSGVPCNPNRRIPHSNPGYPSAPEIQVVTQRAPPSYAEPTVNMDEPPPPYTVEDAGRTNPGF